MYSTRTYSIVGVCAFLSSVGDDKKSGVGKELALICVTSNENIENSNLFAPLFEPTFFFEKRACDIEKCREQWNSCCVK
jgi:hypothetical protein